MKAVLKVLNLRTNDDVNTIKETICKNSGVVACSVDKNRGDVSIVFDDYFITKEQMVNDLEDLGYSVT